MDEQMIWFAYYKEEPVCMFINLPDINQYFKHAERKVWPAAKIVFSMVAKNNEK